MFSSTILDVVVGLIFTFFTVSVIASAATEGLASILQWRSSMLLDGVKDLLNNNANGELVLALYNHALVNPRDSGTAQSLDDVKLKPAYIDPLHFAGAVIDTIQLAPGVPDKMKADINSNTMLDQQLKTLLCGMVDRTAGQMANVHAELATWFDNAMDRVSGVYKRRSQLVSFLIGLSITVLLNVDAIQVCKTLWQQPMLTKSIAVEDNATPQQVLDKLDELRMPIGWTTAKFTALGSPAAFESLLGWLITASATLFGAAFWFDVLQNFVRLKGTGPSPSEKKQDSGAAA